jgi:hypothetical protein
MGTFNTGGFLMGVSDWASLTVRGELRIQNIDICLYIL